MVNSYRYARLQRIARQNQVLAHQLDQLEAQINSQGGRIFTAYPSKYNDYNSFRNVAKYSGPALAVGGTLMSKVDKKAKSPFQPAVDYHGNLPAYKSPMLRGRRNINNTKPKRLLYGYGKSSGKYSPYTQPQSQYQVLTSAAIGPRPLNNARSQKTYRRSSSSTYRKKRSRTWKKRSSRKYY